MKKAPSSGKYMVPVVVSTFRILAELSKSGAIALNEITKRTGVSKSTVFRILTTLNNLGYVVRDSQRHYHVSENLAALVNAEAGVDALRQTALPYMLKLRDLSGETINLGKLQLDRVVYLEVVPSEFALRLAERVGATAPIHGSALGKAILAFSPADFAADLIRTRELEAFTSKTIVDPEKWLAELPRVKERGYAFDRSEASTLATCVAAPILGSDGTAVAAVSISGPTSRFNPRRDSPVLAELLSATRAVTQRLQGRLTGGQASRRA